MIERLFYTALKEEIDELGANPEALNRFLAQLDLPEQERAGVIRFFNKRAPRIYHNYPRLEEVVLPLYAIILESEMESTNWLGDYEGIITEEIATTLGDLSLIGADIIGALYTAKYSIWTVVEENPDLTLYYYQIAKYALMKRRNLLKTQGIISMKLSGKDIGPDQHYMPSNVFIRRLDIECVYDFSIVGNLPFDGGVGEIDGIYVRDINQSTAGVIPTEDE